MDGLHSCLSLCLSAQVLAAKLLNFVLPNMSLGRIDSSVLSRNKAEVSVNGHGVSGDSKQVKRSDLSSLFLQHCSALSLSGQVMRIQGVGGFVLSLGVRGRSRV